MENKIEQTAANYIRLIPLLFSKLGDPNNGASARKTPADLTHLQIHILEDMFHREDGLTMTQLAKNIRVSKQQLTPLVAKLEEKDYVDKFPDPADKRAVRLTLTDKGRAVVNVRWEQAHRDLCGQMEDLNEEDLADLDYSITKIKRILSRLD